MWGKAEDAGGLSPAKDGSDAMRPLGRYYFRVLLYAGVLSLGYNNRAALAIQNIERVYSERPEKHDFGNA